jgi:hypothetical protein
MILNLAGFGRTVFQNVAAKYVWPAVHSHVSELRTFVREKVLRENNVRFVSETKYFFQGTVQICGDAQFDSRGFSALLCRYSFLDSKTHLLVHHEVLHKDEENVASNALELLGFTRSLDFLTTKLNWIISSVTTDRHKGITKFMESKGISHFFDSWHIIKSLRNIWRTVSFPLITILTMNTFRNPKQRNILKFYSLAAQLFHTSIMRLKMPSEMFFF